MPFGSQLLVTMIRISGISGEIMQTNDYEGTLWEIAKKVKREYDIPTGEQKYYHGYEFLSKSMTIKGPMDLTMVRSNVVCGGCGRTQKKRKYKVCSHCFDTCYCSASCQKTHWNCHKQICTRKTKATVDVTHEHRYKRVYPHGPRDNNEYDLVCECGHVA